jgi:lysophospholipase L1-like esterase
MRALLVALAAAFLALVAPVAAQAPPALTLTLDASQTGWIAATVTGAAPGQAVRIAEITGNGVGEIETLATVTADAGGRAVLPRAAAWSCARRRSLRAVVDGPGGAAASADATVTTPACDARRVAVVLRPARLRAGRRATVEVADRWRVGGLRLDVCDGAPGRPARDCHRVTLRAGALRGAARFRVARAGRWPVAVRFAGVTIRRTLQVLPASRRLSVLAAGDSMMQILDDDLHRRLAARGPVRVTDDAHISTGISKPFMFDWVAHAKATASSLRPDVSVVFLGANDGFGIGDAGCCGGVWQARYAKRAGRMMRSYARGGRGTVYWLLLPVPKRPAFVPVYAAVNRALRAAAARFPGVVHLVDLRAVFTPGGRFRQTMTWHGKRLNVRQSDGVHLSVAGAEIAAEVVMRRMRSDGLIS